MNEGEYQNSLLEQFDAAYAKVTLDRRDIYGAPEDTYRRVATMRSVVDECQDPQIREILAMVATKIARLVQTPDHLDSWIDVAGYARCGVMLLNGRSLGQQPSPRPPRPPDPAIGFSVGGSTIEPVPERDAAP